MRRMDAETYAKLKSRVTAITKPDPALFTYYVWTSLMGIVSVLALPYFYFHYHTLKYVFDEEGIAMSYGVLLRREMHLTYARIQDIHLSQNILQRWLGIGTVTVQTAGGGAGSDLQIEGTRDFEAIRDYLYAQLRGIRTGALPDASASTTAMPSTSTDALLVEIRDELRAATNALG